MSKNREMDKKILSEIIAAGGSCRFVTEHCGECPLARAYVRDDGSKGSCLAAVFGGSNTKAWDKCGTQADHKFLGLAIRLLADIAIEEMLEENEQQRS